MDIYESYKCALENPFRYVVPGGVTAFDEYGLAEWPGATIAIDEFLTGRPEKLAKSIFTNRYYMIKAS